jgi:hypothetical protein
MFIHIVAVDKQLSVHAEEGKPLSHAVNQAFKYHKVKQLGKHKARDAKGKLLNQAKSPKALGLKEGDMVYVS